MFLHIFECLSRTSRVVHEFFELSFVVPDAGIDCVQLLTPDGVLGSEVVEPFAEGGQGMVQTLHSGRGMTQCEILFSSASLQEKQIDLRNGLVLLAFRKQCPGCLEGYRDGDQRKCGNDAECQHQLAADREIGQAGLDWLQHVVVLLGCVQERGGISAARRAAD
ncbi:hypothetical protein FQZ97_765350 [compost metagenome]